MFAPDAVPCYTYNGKALTGGYDRQCFLEGWEAESNDHYSAIAREAEELKAALREAHRVILHEMDNGRTPYLLKAENGGKGLGYFENVITGVKNG